MSLSMSRPQAQMKHPLIKHYLNFYFLNILLLGYADEDFLQRAREGALFSPSGGPTMGSVLLLLLLILLLLLLMA